MTARVWWAVADLAALWRSSPYVEEYIAGARMQLAFCTAAGGDHVPVQPFYLGLYLPTVMRNSPFARSLFSLPWLEKGACLADGYTTMIEWLRSRLGGYPFPDAPQLATVSPWSRFTVSMQVPWLTEKRRWVMQDRTQPPVIPFLAVAASAQREAGTSLGTAVASSPAAVEVEERWRELTAEDKSQLSAACQRMRQARYPEPADVRADQDFHELAWQEYVLDQALRSLPERAQAFTGALTRADRLIQQAATLFGQLVMFNQVRQLSHIALVHQLDSADGYQTVRSDSFTFEPIRLFEIVGFDHPYPRGVMLVEGTADQLGPLHGSLTVHGRILADSEELAATATPIQAALPDPQIPQW
jgi:hypothetical protein